MEKQTKLFEVILPPTDMLEKELEDVLGGMGFCRVDECIMNFGDCGYNHCERNYAGCNDNGCNRNCPEGYRWGGDSCGCIPIG